jgi:DNA-binding NarL/FixJ family response regulator
VQQVVAAYEQQAPFRADGLTEGPPGSAVDVLIATDIRFYRDGLAAALAANDHIDVVSVTSTVDETMTAVAVCQPAVVLVDAGMPGAHALARVLLQRYPAIKLIALGMRDDGLDVVAWAQLGVHGYVTRDASIEHVARAIERVMGGELSCSPRMGAFLLTSIAPMATGRSSAAGTLTTRELEIIELVAAHLTNKQIAQRLNIGLPTVKNHLHNSFEKLKIQRRSEAAAWLGANALRADRRAIAGDRWTTPVGSERERAAADRAGSRRGG